ncbi:MAG: hypothetical protein AB7N76_26695 [Planctomycetota bacterium]
MLGASYALALLVRAAVASRTSALYPDGVVELRVAEALLAGRWGQALDTRFHPLLGGLTALVSGLSGLSTEAAATLVCGLLSAGVAPACAAVAARLTPEAPRRAAMVAGVLAACHPYLARLGGQVLAYGPAHLCLALALALAARALAVEAAGAGSGAGSAPGAGRAAALAGLAAGAGYLARSDALASGAGLGLGLGAALLLRGSGAARALRAAGAFGLAFGLAIAPYALALSLHAGTPTLSPKKPLASFWPAAVGPAAPAPHPDGRAQPRERTLEEWVADEITRGPRAAAAEAEVQAQDGLLAAARFALGKALAATHPLLALLLLSAALPARGGRARSGPSRATREDLAPLLPALGALGAFVAAHVLLKATHGYTSRLHMSAAGVLVAPLAARGLLRLGRRRWIQAALLGLAVTLTLPRAIEPQHEAKAVEAEVGRWLRDHAPRRPLVVCGRGEVRGVAYRAGARFVDLPADTSPRRALEHARARGARYLVLYLRSRGPERGALLAHLATLGARPLGPPWRSERAGVRYAWWVLALD